MDRNSDIDDILAGMAPIRKAEDAAAPSTASQTSNDATARAHRSEARDVPIGLVEQRLNTLLTARVEQMMAELTERLMTAVNERVADVVNRHLAPAATKHVAAADARSATAGRLTSPSGFTWRIRDDD
jgi:hypothetical protein